MKKSKFRGRVISFDNPKMLKTSSKKGVLSSILHFSPHESSGIENVCPYADGCQKLCLHYAGINFPSKFEGRKRKTKLFLECRDCFMEDYIHDLHYLQRKANELGVKAVHRPNGTSDIRWEYVQALSYNKNIFEQFPDIQFVDYTKWPLKFRDISIPNYDITFSLSISKENEENARKALDMGIKVSAVFAVKRKDSLPETFMGCKVIDGDLHDARYLDKKGVIVGLRAKGLAVFDNSGFVRNPNTGKRITSDEQWKALGFKQRNRHTNHTRTSCIRNQQRLSQNKRS